MVGWEMRHQIKVAADSRTNGCVIQDSSRSIRGFRSVE